MGEMIQNRKKGRKFTAVLPNPDKPEPKKRKIKSARKVAETQKIRKGFLCDALCAFASLREILAFWDLNFISCQKACARMLLSSMAENNLSDTKMSLCLCLILWIGM